MRQQQASDKRGHTILLGGLGGDSQSAGLIILLQQYQYDPEGTN